MQDVNTYLVNSGGRTRELGRASSANLAATDAYSLSQYATLPFTDPAGGRRLSTGGQVWLERTGSAGWLPLIYSGARPPASDAPSTGLGKWVAALAIAGAIAAAVLL